MANKRGFEIIDGKAYLDGVEIQGGGGGGSTPIHNTFNKICVFGTSIEVNPTTGSCWPYFLAQALGIDYRDGNHPNGNLINFAVGGGGITWYADELPEGDELVDPDELEEGDTQYNHLDAATKALVDGFISQFGGALCCTDAEKNATGQKLVSMGAVTSAQLNSWKSSPSWNNSYDKSLLQHLDADLYIFGTSGINDRHGWMNWVDGNGYTQKSYTLHKELEYDRRTIYGAYNYLLKKLYDVKPNAKVVILGQHTFMWDNQDAVNGIQRAVAETWQIPFADWGNHLSLDGTFRQATNGALRPVPDGQGGSIIEPNAGKTTIYQTDMVHPSATGAQLMAAWVAKWITETELKPLNPRFIDLT